MSAAGQVPVTLVIAVCLGLFSCVGDPPLARAEASAPLQEGLPYLPLIETLIDHVGYGRIDEAIVLLENDTTKGVPAEKREEARRMLATIYGSGGKYDGYDMVRVQHVTPRLHKVYALAYYQRHPIVYNFTMYQFDGEWKIHHVHWDDKIDQLAEKVR